MVLQNVFSVLVHNWIFQVGNSLLWECKNNGRGDEDYHCAGPSKFIGAHNSCSIYPISRFSGGNLKFMFCFNANCFLNGQEVEQSLSAEHTNLMIGLVEISSEDGGTLAILQVLRSHGLLSRIQQYTISKALTPTVLQPIFPCKYTTRFYWHWPSNQFTRQPNPNCLTIHYGSCWVSSIKIPIHHHEVMSHHPSNVISFETEGRDNQCLENLD